MFLAPDSRSDVGAVLRRFQESYLNNGSTAPVPGSHQQRVCRTVWISDTHLGTRGCKAAWLLDFLQNHRCETMYLVGDIIDGWQLRKDWYWTDAQHAVVKLLFERARTGTRIIFVPGNHDEFARDFFGITFGCIEVRPEAEHTTLGGRRFLVTHGDQFDGIVQHAKWLAFTGDTLYCLILRLNHWLNRIRSRLGMRYWSLSQYLKHRVKNAVSFISDYEQALTDEARRRGFDGVICGHIHKAEIRMMGKLQYVNCGDWVESLTAITEDYQGELSLVEWRELLGPPAEPETAGAQQAPEIVVRKERERDGGVLV